MRLDNIAELFAEDANINSLKNKNTYLQGRDKIRQSFQATKPRAAAVAKRVLINAPNKEASDASPSFTFCIDMHRAQCSPGLGDVSKNSILLYRCDNKHIANVWGMTDTEGLAVDKELTLTNFLNSAAWRLVSAILESDVDLSILDATTEPASLHFHNYDAMDIWG